MGRETLPGAKNVTLPLFEEMSGVFKRYSCFCGDVPRWDQHACDKVPETGMGSLEGL